jgi:hypothetical protein
MAWSDLCGGSTVTGKEIDLATLYGFGGDGTRVDHNKRGKTGLPAAETLSKMVGRADGLKLKDVKGKGISFHVAHCAIGGDGNPALTTLLNQFVNDKPGAAVCYEDVVLPRAAGPGHILVHQSMAPCTRCRAGYKEWARSRGCTIIVSADEGYDGSGDNKVFVFCPTGRVFFG